MSSLSVPLLTHPVLKGYMFLTRQRICFFAHIPVDENTVIRSGPMWKKSSQTKLSTKSWFVLRNGVLSWFESSNVGGHSCRNARSDLNRIPTSPRA